MVGKFWGLGRMIGGFPLPLGQTDLCTLLTGGGVVGGGWVGGGGWIGGVISPLRGRQSESEP